MMWGALLFVISDSVLAINKFYNRFDRGRYCYYADLWVAQLFIVEGAVKYITSVLKE